MMENAVTGGVQRAGNRYIGLYGMQAKKLYDEQKQAYSPGPHGAEEVLQILQSAYDSSGNSVISRRCHPWRF